MKTVKMNSIQMADFLPEPGVVVIETEDRIGGVEAVLRRAEELMAGRRFAEVVVASSRRRVSDGLKWNKASASLELCASASDNNLHVWCVCWCELQKRIEEVQGNFHDEKVKIVEGETVGCVDWNANDFLTAELSTLPSTLHVWDVGVEDVASLPIIDGEARRRELCFVVVKTIETHDVSDGEYLPNIHEISAYERALALIRTEGRLTRSMAQREFGLSFREANVLMERLVEEGVLRESVEEDADRRFEVDWDVIPRGPKLRI